MLKDLFLDQRGSRRVQIKHESTHSYSSDVVSLSRSTCVRQTVCIEREERERGGGTLSAGASPTDCGGCTTAPKALDDVRLLGKTDEGETKMPFAVGRENIHHVRES